MVIPTSSLPPDQATSPRVTLLSAGDESADDEDSHFVANDMNSSVIELDKQLSRVSVMDDKVTEKSTASHMASVNTEEAEANVKHISGNFAAQEPQTESHESMSNSVDADDSMMAGDTTLLDGTHDDTVIDSAMVDITMTEAADDNALHADTDGSDTNSLKVDELDTVRTSDDVIQGDSAATAEHPSSSASQIAGTDKTVGAHGSSPSGKKSKTPGRKPGGKSVMTTIKRGKGKTILQDMNANMGFENSQKDKPSNAKVT